MNSKTKAIIFLAAFLAIGFFIYNSVRDKTPFAGKKPAVGDIAPEISLSDLSGKMVRLSDFKGEVVLINFWASWCLPCKAEMAWFQKIYMAYEEKGFAVIGIAVNDVPVSYLVGKDGKIVKKLKGVYTENVLKADLEKALGSQ